MVKNAAPLLVQTNSSAEAKCSFTPFLAQHFLQSGWTPETDLPWLS